MLDHYASASGRQVDDIDYYLVLAKWQRAIVLEQGYERAAGDPKLEGFGPSSWTCRSSTVEELFLRIVLPDGPRQKPGDDRVRRHRSAHQAGVPP